MKKYMFQTVLLGILCFLLAEHLILESCLSQVSVSGNIFRNHQLNDAVLEKIKNAKVDRKGEIAGKYLLAEHLPKRFQKSDLDSYFKTRELDSYFAFCDSIWEEIQYFPIPESTLNKNYTVSYVDTWNASRSFGGERGHEGTDIMAYIDQPGLYPVVSMTDGIVTQKGWLTLGGWRIGILTPSGSYFYYAHLNSYADIEVGQEIEAGDLLGFMGDSGYGEEGTTGKFATHLHIGIYIYPDGEEVSIDPYWILKLAEEKKLFCSY